VTHDMEKLRKKNERNTKHNGKTQKKEWKKYKTPAD
jgi:hypothetical protein